MVDSKQAADPGDDDRLSILETLDDAVDADLRALFRHLVAEIPYEEFERRMKASVFSRVAKLAVLDEWFPEEVEDERLAEHLKVEPEKIREWRKTPDYETITERAREAMGRIKDAGSMEEQLSSKAFQTRLLREMTALATRSRTPWIRQKAGEALLDRTAPKLTKQTGQGQAQFYLVDPEMFKRFIDVFHEDEKLKDVGPTSQVHEGPLAIPARAGES